MWFICMHVSVCRHVYLFDDQIVEFTSCHLCLPLTHSLLRLVKPTFPIELNRKQNHFQRNAIIVENYYCIANTSVTTKLHILNICKLWFSFLIL